MHSFGSDLQDHYFSQQPESYCEINTFVALGALSNSRSVLNAKTIVSETNA